MRLGRDRQPFENVSQQMAVFLHAAQAELHQIVEAARNEVTFQHVGHVQQLLAHAVEHIARLGRQFDFHKNQQGLAQRLRVDAGVVAGDHPGTLHALDPLGTRRGRQPDFAGQIGHGDAAVALQEIQNAAVDAIEFVHGGWRTKRGSGFSDFHCEIPKKQ